MAFKIDCGYGDGELGDLEISEGAVQDINSYADITAIDSNTVTINIDSMIEGKYNTFRAGVDIMIHCSATNRETADHLGKYIFAKITLVNNGVLTLDKNVEDFFSGVNLDYEYIQAITVPNFDCLKLREGAVVTVPPYNPYTHVGGILILRCWQDLLFDGGNIDLRDCGIPYNRKNGLRPLTTQETAANGETDKAKLSGQENFITAERFLLNAGDGAAFIIAKNLICSDDSRIGNPATHGAQFCRGAADSVGVKPSNITNIGGSTILIAAENIENFTPKIIAKYRSADLPAGKGLCRCYIASNTVLRTDEGLYSYDTLSNKNKVRELGIEDFGNGNFGDLTNPTRAMNNYATVVSSSQGGYRLRVSGRSMEGLAYIRPGALVMLLISPISDKATKYAGKFIIARILATFSYFVVTSKPLPKISFEDYYVQLITIPEFNNLTINTNYNYTPKYSNGRGGVFAVAVNDTFNLENGKINVEGKGGVSPYGRAGLAYIGNAQNSDRLPLGEGHGSVFILAKNLVMNENSRIGALYSGSGTGGRLGGNNATGTNQGGGYAGGIDEDQTGSGAGFVGGGAGSASNSNAAGGSGANGGGGTVRGEIDSTKITGGYGSSGAAVAQFQGGCQGAHLMIVADKITGFTQNAISTGGEGGKGTVNGVPGAASFGGGGAKDGSSGGSGGFAFLYVNDLD